MAKETELSAGFYNLLSRMGFGCGCDFSIAGMPTHKPGERFIKHVRMNCVENLNISNLYDNVR